MAIGFVGLGRMGGGMARNLAKTVSPLFIYDPRAAAMAPLADAGATSCASAAQVAKRCDTIVLCLPFAPEVRAALFGPDGIAAGARDGLTIIDTTTLDRLDAIAIAQEAAESGIAYWDCPVSGMPFRADNGTLTVMFGGTETAFAKAEPFLACFGESVIHCGPVGSGQAMKAINNIIYNVNIAAICEMLPLTAAIGLNPEQVARVVLSGSSRSFAADYFVPRMLEGRFDTDFTLKEAHKDIVNVQRMAEELKVKLPVVEAMIGDYEAALDAGFGGEPKSSMLKVFERHFGVKFRKPGFETA